MAYIIQTQFANVVSSMKLLLQFHWSSQDTKEYDL